MRITPKLIEDLRKNYGKLPPKHFAEKYNLSVRTIHTLAYWNKFTRKLTNLPENEEQIIEEYKNGASLKALKRKTL